MRQDRVIFPQRAEFRQLGEGGRVLYALTRELRMLAVPPLFSSRSALRYFDWMAEYRTVKAVHINESLVNYMHLMRNSNRHSIMITKRQKGKDLESVLKKYGKRAAKQMRLYATSCLIYRSLTTRKCHLTHTWPHRLCTSLAGSQAQSSAMREGRGSLFIVQGPPHKHPRGQWHQLGHFPL